MTARGVNAAPAPAKRALPTRCCHSAAGAASKVRDSHLPEELHREWKGRDKGKAWVGGLRAHRRALGGVWAEGPQHGRLGDAGFAVRGLKPWPHHLLAGPLPLLERIRAPRHGCRSLGAGGRSNKGADGEHRSLDWPPPAASRAAQRGRQCGSAALHSVSCCHTDHPREAAFTARAGHAAAAKPSLNAVATAVGQVSLPAPPLHPKAACAAPPALPVPPQQGPPPRCARGCAGSKGGVARAGLQSASAAL